MKNKHKLKQGLSLLLAGGIVLTNMGAAMPAFAEDAPATPETAEAATPESAAPAEQPVASDGGLSVEEIQSRMYPSLPQAATGYYLDSNGLPVLTGETKISIEGWGDEDYSAYDADSTIQVALDDTLLNADSAVASFPHMGGEDYAIVPISVQVLYPANGGSADITLPDNVELLGYSFTSGDLCAATEEERQRQLHYDFSEVTASVAGIYVKATEDFSVTLTYTDSETSLTKTLHVTLNDSAPFPGILQDRFVQEAQPATYSADADVATYAGLQVTQCVYTSVGWMNYLGGQPALCADNGKWAWGPGATYANKYPPVANYSSAGKVWVLAAFFGKGWTADQATMWAQGFNSGAPSAAATYSAEDMADNSAYLDRLAWQSEQFPDSLASEIINGAATYADDAAETVYIGTLYVPSNAAWQRFVILNYTPVTLGGDNEIPELTPEGKPVDKPWSASYERTETLDFSYTINTDKIQLETLEKVDGAGIDIAPILDGIPSDINGGSWTITPAGKQSVTTGGHTQDNSYHLTGGDASATWTVHYSVSKAASQSGSVTANSEQDADAQAAAAQSAAQSTCENQVNGEIEAALSAVHRYFDSLKFSYDEVIIPHGFDSTPGALGSHQTITVPANSSNDYKMQNDEWSVKVSIDKIDSETKQRIKGDAEFKIFEWDTVRQCYIPTGGYNQYKVERQSDGTYKVINHSNYANGSDNIYYTQRNEGKFVIVESRAPSGYYGDWSDVNAPGMAGSVLGKRAYAFEITKALDGQIIWLGKSDRVWQVVGNATNDMDEYIVTEKYCNHETLGQLTIRKLGNVLTDYKDSQFIYTQDNLAGAVYEIHADGDIATPDRQGTYWYKNGDLVATVTTGAAGQVDEVKFSPTRTQATYDFLTSSHDGTKGEVTVNLPLGKYTITEVKAPYGFILTQQTYTVEFGWDNQKNDIVLAKTIVSHEQDGDKECSYSVVNVKDASDAHKTGQTLVFENARVLPVPEKPGDKVGKIGVGIYKQDREALTYLPGAVYELYTVDDIYSSDGTKLLDTGAKLATSNATNASGFTWFDVDVPIRSEDYPDSGNSGRYRIVEITAPAGYLLNSTPVDVEFTYEGQQTAWQVVDGTNTNLRTTVDISKQDMSLSPKMKRGKWLVDAYLF